MARDLGVSTSSGGGALASATQLQLVAEAVRPALVLELLGAQRVEVSGVADISFPRFAGGSGGWLTEGEPSVSDSATIDSVSCTPHCAGARLALSRKVRNGAREDVEAAVLRELQQCVAATLEAGFLVGTGTNSQPLGLLHTPGIGTQSFAGAVASFGELQGMIESYLDADGSPEAARFLVNPSDFSDLLAVAIQWEDNAWRISGIPVATTRHLTEGKVLLLDPSAVALAYFGPAQVVMDEYSNGKSISGAAEICIFNFADVAVLRPAQIVVGSA
jgi:HK97 family phage major capsid protein